jgi:cbb3-type cytochrome oxidase subunit 3
MTSAAIGTTVFMAVVLIGGLIFCFSKMGKGGGGWED